MAPLRVITKPKYGQVLLLFFGSLMCFFFATLIIKGHTRDEFQTTWGRFFLGGFFALFALYCLYYVLRTGKVIREKDEVVFYSLLGFPVRRVKPTDIVSFTEAEKENDYGTYVQLKLYTAKGSFKIWSSSYDNYFALRGALTTQAKRDRQREKANERRGVFVTGIVLIASGIFLAGIPVYQYFGREGSILPDELTSVSGTVSDLEVGFDLGDDVARMAVRLREYPALLFRFHERGLNKDRIGRAALNLRRNAPVTLSVKSAHYRQKVSGEESAGFFRWPGSKNNVLVYAAKDHEYNYLLLSEFNAGANGNSEVWFLALIALFPLGLGSYLLSKLRA